MKSTETAILFFTRTGQEEAKAKPLGKGRRASEAIAEYAIQSIQKIIQRTEFPVFIVSERQQRGDTFGERFANAFDHVFNQGYDQVIALGNDCLSMTKDDILSAHDILQNNTSVLGATIDGGAFLIGMRRNVFDKMAFQDLNWQSKDTFNSLMAYFTSFGESSIFIAKKSDIDSIDDWSIVIQTVSKQIKKRLLQLFDVGKKVEPIYFSNIFKDLCNTFYKSLRAPPFA